MPRGKSGSSTAPQTDALSGEVTIRAHLDDKGLTVAGKSRALAAFDRLVGGIVGIPAEFFEGIRRRAELKGQAREQFIKDQSLQSEALLASLTPVRKVAAQRGIADETRKQINREAVWVEAVKVLPENLESSTSSNSKSESIEDDWINVFALYAEKASSERLQQLWGRILSGEIRKPGLFSLSTLRVLSEMDSIAATAFQEVALHRLNDGMLIQPKDLSGSELEKWSILEEAGLVQDVSGGLGLDLKSEGATHEKPVRVAYAQVENHILGVTIVKEIPYFRVPLVKITRAGQQIASILPRDSLGTLRSIASSIDKDVGLEIVRIEESDDGSRKFELVEVLKPTPTMHATLVGEHGIEPT